MARKDIIRMSGKELNRIKTIHSVLEKEITQKKAADILDLSDRQIRRIVKRVREEGNKGLTHRSRGRQGHRAIPEDVKAKRVLRNDFTISYNGKLYQIEDNVRARELTVEERIDGKTIISYKGMPLRYKRINKRPERVEGAPTFNARTIYKPPVDHLWRGIKVKEQYRQYQPSCQL